ELLEGKSRSARGWGRHPGRHDAGRRVLGEIEPILEALGAVDLEDFKIELDFGLSPIVRYNNPLGQAQLFRLVPDDDGIELLIDVDPLALEHGPDHIDHFVCLGVVEIERTDY